MKYLWIGICIDDYLKMEIIKYGGQLYSGHIANDSLFQGFLENDIVFDSINGRGIKYFPKYKQLILKRHVWHEYGGKHVSVSYLNGKYSRIISRTISMKREIKKWIKHNKSEDLMVFIYGLSTPSISVTKILKKKNPNAIISLIIPDLPEYKDLNASPIKKMLKKLESFYINRYIKNVDYFFPFAEKMAEYLKLPKNSWMVMEGSINSLDISSPCDTFQRKNAIMYAGICNYDFGIDILLNAFEKVPDKDVELWIAGTGNAQDLIRNFAKHDTRIKYFGYISHENVLLLEKQAIGVINLRNPNQNVSQYAFPSKIFEYMLSASIVLTFRVQGIPNEYYNYLKVMEEASEECVAKNIIDVLNMTLEERNLIGNKAREYVIANKTNIKQAKRMLDFICKRGEE